MKRVLTAVVLVPLVLLIVVRAPLWLFALVVGGAIILALREYLNIAEQAGVKPFRRLSYATAMVLVYSFWEAFGARRHFFPSSGWWMPFLLGSVIFGIPLVLRKDLGGGLAAAAVSGFGVVYLAGSLSLLLTFRAIPFQQILLIFVLSSVWAGDISAYYVGRSMGRHKLAPVVSPNKSWEGAIASVAGSVIASLLVFHFRSEISGWFSERYTLLPGGREIGLAHMVVLGVLTNVAAQFGDLFESALKRGAGVKDSGSLLPGHGGVLDRIDALLFAIPVVWYYANLTGFLQPKFF
jgi:phosphatidate cytidylyltransferase